jgi:acetylornithine/succinyldiaminopimelate/putrescine aminotransferase
MCFAFFSVRFAPPLVIEEEDLLRAVKIIGECLVDLDKVRPFLSPSSPI